MNVAALLNTKKAKDKMILLIYQSLSMYFESLLIKQRKQLNKKTNFTPTLYIIQKIRTSETFLKN